MTDASDTTDYSKHSDDELREGIAKAQENLRRMESEGSDDQVAAAKDQHDAMQAELSRRQS